MNEKLEKFLNRERVALHTPTEEIKNKLMEFCLKYDIKLREGEDIDLKANNRWERYKENTCYSYFNMGLRHCYNRLNYGSVFDYKEDEYKVLELTMEDFEDNDKIEITFNGNKTYASTGDLKVSVTCHKNDIYNKRQGVKKAVDKLFLTREKKLYKGMKYWIVTHDGHIRQNNFNYDRFDHRMKSFNNFFFTRQEAVEALNKIKEVLK